MFLLIDMLGALTRPGLKKALSSRGGRMGQVNRGFRDIPMWPVQGRDQAWRPHSLSYCHLSLAAGPSWPHQQWGGQSRPGQGWVLGLGRSQHPFNIHHTWYSSRFVIDIQEIIFNTIYMTSYVCLVCFRIDFPGL